MDSVIVNVGVGAFAGLMATCATLGGLWIKNRKNGNGKSAVCAHHEAMQQSLNAGEVQFRELRKEMGKHSESLQATRETVVKIATQNDGMLASIAEIKEALREAS